MKIVVACDSYKGSCSSVKAVQYIKKGVLRACPDAVVETIPMADGGEGLVETILEAVPGRLCTAQVTDPLGRPISAAYGVLGDGSAVIEMAAASGLPLLSRKERNPLLTTTYGTGELVRTALDQGCRKIMIGIGGSATNDGGAGMAQALGVRFLDREGRELPFGGGALGRLYDIDVSGLDPRLAEAEIVVACDVDNPLCGEKGASVVYGPQKGASPEMVRNLDRNLAHFARIAEGKTGRRVATEKGAGAAGGLGAGLMLFCGAQMKSGIDTVLDITNFDGKCQGADLVITGEGRLDYQSVHGKVPVGVAGRVKKQEDIPVIALVGSIGERAWETYAYGIGSVFSIVPGPVSLEYALENVEELMTDASERIMRLFRMASFC